MPPVRIAKYLEEQSTCLDRRDGWFGRRGIRQREPIKDVPALVVRQGLRQLTESMGVARALYLLSFSKTAF